MKVLFDTSVLVPAFIVNHPQHSVCFSKIKAAKSGQIQGFISTHSLAETYSVITRLPIQPRISPQQAEMIIVDIFVYKVYVNGLLRDLKSIYFFTLSKMKAFKLCGFSMQGKI